MRTLLLLAVLGACGTERPVDQTPPEMQWPYPQVPADPQRAGNAQQGYDYLINGGYITCGIPKATYDSVLGGGSAETLAGRTGANATLPFNYSVAKSSEGVDVVSANCLACHAGHINGQLVVGLGASEGDFTANQAQLIDAAAGLSMPEPDKTEMLRFKQRIDAIAPYTQMKVRGVNPADNLTAALMAHRDPATLAWSDTAMFEVPTAVVAPVDVPPWWRMAKKNAMFYTAGGRGDHARIEMAAALLCTDSVAEATAIDAAFVDVRAWIETMTPPAWPWAIDTALASRGAEVYAETCAQCHGTHGADGVYPNELVPLADVGTDAILAQGTAQFAPRFVQWFNDSFWGMKSHLEPQLGYIAPPLDGIWATAPFFHNGSVPTLEGVLDSTKRPKIWNRTFQSTDYDQAAVGWKFTPLDTAVGKVYDTTQIGYGNGGHLYGDTLSSDDRAALLEYMKTL